jgi:hypothetical protein
MDKVIRYSLGLDVDKKSFKACLKVKEINSRSIIKSTKTFDNNLQGFKDLHSRGLKKMQHLLIS